MARPPEQAIDEAVAALGHFELVELGAAVNDLREELKTECALANQLAEALATVIPVYRGEFQAKGDDWFYELGRKTLADYRERRSEDG